MAQSKKKKRLPKIYRYREDLTGELAVVLKRGYYAFKLLSEKEDPEAYASMPCNEGYRLIATNAPSGAFHKMVQRAMCEKMDHESSSGLIHITEKERNDRSFLPGQQGKGKHKITACVVVDS